MKVIARILLRFLLRLDDVTTKWINRIALVYGGGIHVKHRLMKYHDFFVGRVRSGEKVLDIGCGCGAVAYSLATKAGAHVTGIDIDSKNIKKAISDYHHPNIVFFHGDARTDLPISQCDVVVLSNILEHLEYRPEFLKDVQSRFEPNRMLIRVPMFNRDWRVALRKELELFHFSDPTHFTEYTDESFAKEIAVSDLNIHHVEYCWGEIWAEVRPRSSHPADRGE